MPKVEYEVNIPDWFGSDYWVTVHAFDAQAAAEQVAAREDVRHVKMLFEPTAVVVRRGKDEQRFIVHAESDLRHYAREEPTDGE